MNRPRLDFLAILCTLAAHEVDLIVAGGVCGALHGATITTFDLDIVHSRATEKDILALLILRQTLEEKITEMR